MECSAVDFGIIRWRHHISVRWQEAASKWLQIPSGGAFLGCVVDPASTRKGDVTSKERLQVARKAIADGDVQLQPVNAAFESDKRGGDGIAAVRRKIEETKAKIEDAEWRHELQTASGIKYYALSDLQNRWQRFEERNWIRVDKWQIKYPLLTPSGFSGISGVPTSTPGSEFLPLSLSPYSSRREPGHPGSFWCHRLDSISLLRLFVPLQSPSSWSSGHSPSGHPYPGFQSASDPAPNITAEEVAELVGQKSPVEVVDIESELLLPAGIPESGPTTYNLNLKPAKTYTMSELSPMGARCQPYIVSYYIKRRRVRGSGEHSSPRTP
ncbi:hypothetical protein FB45DRAFT_1109087 [Roridomyces roridus]|uniref:Uncharacterized protein n=1 Tax=Roridomyces roridus TaxID=1738132 RepID=A0AAD7FE54_9AGAR|nr:hypothetical protein FB45DRAFT_1109087 [Roridomyces roridus]